ncbi:MAG TPA: glycoside hydrolase family 75 protein [Actinocatenispora sp.]
MARTVRRGLPRAALALLVFAVVAVPLLRSAQAEAASPPTAAQLLAKLSHCDQVSDGMFATDDDGPASVPVCGKTNAVFWQADMDIDCDGQTTAQCNHDTDPAYQDDTAFHQSDDQPLDAAALPYVVIPQNNAIFRYGDHDIAGAAVVAVIYQGQVEYAVFGDTGPTTIIGEASYATADALGIDPDPATGGADSGVSYIVFEGTHVTPIENHDQAVADGVAAAQRFLDEN